MFAPKPFDVAKEMVRVTRPGGRIVMGNWIPNDPTLVAQILKISSAYSPPPPEGFVSPMTWGIEGNVIERFAGAGVPQRRSRSCATRTRFDFPASPSDLVAAFRDLLRADDERVRSGRSRTAAPRSCSRSSRPCSTRRTRAPTQRPTRRFRRRSCASPLRPDVVTPWMLGLIFRSWTSGVIRTPSIISLIYTKAAAELGFARFR